MVEIHQYLSYSSEAFFKYPIIIRSIGGIHIALINISSGFIYTKNVPLAEYDYGKRVNSVASSRMLVATLRRLHFLLTVQKIACISI